MEETENIGATIPTGELRKFRSRSKQNGADQSEGSQGSQKFDEDTKRILGSIDKSLQWVIDRSDTYLKNKGGDGIGSEEYKDEYRDLWMMNIEDWAEDMKKAEFLKHSTKGLLIFNTIGIAVSNAIAFSRKKTENNKLNPQGDDE